MAKNPTPETLALAVTMHDDGKSHKVIMEATGLNHSQVECAIMEANFPKSAFFSVKSTDKDYTAKLEAFIVEGRQVKALSWGALGVLAHIPESRVRKIWAERTGTKSQGLRNGKGGRFLYQEPRLYVEDHRKTGVTIPVEVKGREATLKLLGEGPVVKVRKPRTAKKAATPKAAKTA